jgi:nucleoside-diphosphate-sugar epimerase
MKVLLSGANGYIGRAVARRLQRHGHEVVGLVRSQTARKGLAALGIAAIDGDLDDTGSLARATKEVDAVVETASADHAGSTRTFIEALSGTGKTYLRTSGIGIYTDLAGGELNSRVHTEDDGYLPSGPFARRFAIDQSVIEAADDLRTIVLRPPMIYGYGASEQLPVLLRAALHHNLSGWTGAGANRYSTVHVDDLAGAYQLALEKAPSGAVYNIESGECDFRTIGEAIGALVRVPARPFADQDEADATLGAIWSLGLASNSRVDAAKARSELGWTPVGPGLVEELTTGSYRQVWEPKDATVLSQK